MRLGATPGDGVTSFALRSRNAHSVDLCLFDEPESGVASRTVPLRRNGDAVWHVEVAGVGPGQLYGYRVHGPFAPQLGHRFNPAKLLVDPWARAITGEPRFSRALFSGSGAVAYDGSDSAAAMPKSVVVDPAFDWGEDRSPEVPWEDTVVYEAHVKGLTQLHPEVAPELRGTYLGLASEPIVEHLRALGVTTLELMPVQQIARERHLLESDRRNYWGYAPLGFLAPHAGYASGRRGEQVQEWKTMVRGLHRAGIEVVVDVVLNHTPEGDEKGPTLSLRGLDNAAFYRLWPTQRRRYVDWTGTGNTLDFGRPAALGLALDALRCWAGELHVDGFRLDLAPILGRGGAASGGAFDPAAPLFQAIASDPLLSRLKWIAEPWDLGPGGYRLGQFPAGWGEWNDRFRDGARRFWRGDAARDPGLAADFARRLDGSRDLFPPPAKAAPRSVSFVACHDGFTLADLVAYERKRNEANGEASRDGRDANFSRNWGVEGPSDDPAVVALRERARRNLLASLLLARGVPMLSHGDELGRTQGGNNNAYCHDDRTTWVDWERSDPAFLAFVRELAALRRRFPQLRRAEPAARFLGPDGSPWGGDAWSDAGAGFMARFDGDQDLLLVLNGGDAEVEFTLPRGRRWIRLLASGEAATDAEGGGVALPGFSFAAFAAA